MSIGPAEWQNAQSLQESGRFAEALGAYDALLAHSQDEARKADIMLRQVACFAALGHLADARARLQQAAQLRHDDWRFALEAEFTDTGLLVAEGKPGEALLKLNRLFRRVDPVVSSAQLQPLWQQVQLRRGAVLAGLGRWEQAMAALASVARSDLARRQRALMLYTYGHCYFGLRKFELARQHLLQAIEQGLPPADEVRARHTLGLTYAALGALAEAKAELQACAARAAESDIPPEKIFAALADLCRRAGEEAEAERYRALAQAEG